MARLKGAMTQTTLSQPAIILIRPQMGENIGAAARAMWNFGLDHMRIVNPRDGWPNQKANAMASGAGRLLDEPCLVRSLFHIHSIQTYPLCLQLIHRNRYKCPFLFFLQ